MMTLEIALAVLSRLYVLCASLKARVLGFFFQAEDGIRDRTVTGVQTCALPIWPPRAPCTPTCRPWRTVATCGGTRPSPRSEERRVGKEWKSPWWPYH